MAAGTGPGRGRRRSFDEWYDDAHSYYLAHGDLLIPQNYETEAGWKLGRWISNQRGKYLHRPGAKGSLTETEIARLEQIGMVWQLEHRFSWTEWLAVCRQYRKMHGDLLVPAAYREGEHRLGDWIREKRKQYWKGALTPAQISELDALGMAWAVGFKREWDEWYADAGRYRRVYGDLLMPRSYETPEGFALGVWIFEQRRIAQGKKRKDRLSADQIRRLDEIGMVWDLSDVS